MADQCPPFDTAAARGRSGSLRTAGDGAAGHGGASGRYDALRETAIDYAFVLSVLGRAGR